MQPLTQDERASLPVKQAILVLDQSIRDRTAIESDSYIPPELEDDEYLEYEAIEPEATQQDVDEVTPEVLDNLMSAEVLLPKGDILLPARVIARKRNAEGNLIGTQHANPIMDTRIYDVQFPDGHVEAYSANAIAENIYAQVDVDGQRFVLLDEIMDHRKDNSAVKMDDKYIKHGSNQMLRENNSSVVFPSPLA